MTTDRRALTTLWACTGLLVGAVLLSAGTLVRNREAEALAESEGRVERFASGAEAAINRSFLGTDVLLAGLAAPLSDLGGIGAAGSAERHNRLLAQVVMQNLWLRDVALLAEDGQVLAAGQDSSRRLGVPLPLAFVQEVLAATPPALAISAPVLNPATAEQALYFARPLLLQGGRRALVVAEVPVSLVAGITAPLADMPGLTVTLERSDGTLLAAVPPVARLPAQPLAPARQALAASGNAVQAEGRLDGAPSLVVARNTLYPGVQLLASLHMDDALREGARRRGTVAVVAVGLSAVLVLVAALGHWHVRRLGAARRALASSKSTLDQALASMSEGLMLLDRDDRVVAWNRRYLELYPWLAPVMVVGTPLKVLAETAAMALLPDATAQERADWMAWRMAQRDSERPFSQVLQGHVIVNTTEHRTPDGGTLSVHRDVTSAERELARAKAAAEAANEAKSRFLATMSHEMRTPLNGVLGMIGLLLAGPLNPPQRRQAELIRSSGQTLLAVLNDILDLSKIEAGRMTLEIAPFRVAETAQDVVHLLAVRAQARGLALSLHLAPGLPPVLCGDASRLRQVLFNLVGNALKFTEVGRVDVTLSAEPRSDERGGVMLSVVVQDTGIGIPAEALPRLFTRFTQADSSTARRYGGTGLGLAITREIVTLMHGDISVRSSPGAGSRFTVQLPLAVGELPERPVPTPPPELPASISLQVASAAPRRPLRILAADDNTVNQMLIKALLEDAGHACDVVANGIEAVHQLQAAHYDLVLMDIQMPEMDGMAATRAIRALQRPEAITPILAMTANLLPEQRARYLEAGMQGVVIKPIDPDQLEEAIAQAMPMGLLARTAGLRA